MRSALSTLLALFCAVADVTAQVRGSSVLPPWAEALAYAPTELYRLRIGDFGYPFINVEINGKSLELPFDTGNMTGLSLTAELISHLNLPLIGQWTSLDSNGRVVGRYRAYRAAEVRAFGRTTTGDSVYELAHPALPGLVGPQLLSGLRFTVDYENGVMGVSSQPLPASAGERLPLVSSRHRPLLLLVRGRVHGRDALFEIDTGKSRSTIDPQFARQLNLTIDDKGARNLRLEIGSRSFDVPAAKLVDLRNIDPSLPDPILVGVGSDILRQLVWTIDYRTGTLLLTSQAPDSTDRRQLQLISALEVAARSPSYSQGYEFADDTNLFYRAGGHASRRVPAHAGKYVESSAIGWRSAAPRSHRMQHSGSTHCPLETTK